MLYAAPPVIQARVVTSLQAAGLFSRAQRLVRAQGFDLKAPDLTMLTPEFERLRAFMLAGESDRSFVVRRFKFGEALDVTVMRVHEIETVVQQIVSPTGISGSTTVCLSGASKADRKGS